MLRSFPGVLPRWRCVCDPDPRGAPGLSSPLLGLLSWSGSGSSLPPPTPLPLVPFVFSFQQNQFSLLLLNPDSGSCFSVTQIRRFSFFPDPVSSSTGGLHIPDPKAPPPPPDAHSPSGVCLSLATTSQRRLSSEGSRWEVAATRSSGNGRRERLHLKEPSHSASERHDSRKTQRPVCRDAFMRGGL